MESEHYLHEIVTNLGPIFPVDASPDRKCPLIKGWQEKATTNPKTTWSYDKGVGIKTGRNGVTNLIVIDTDTDFAEALLKKYLCEEELDTYTVKTRRGKHYYYYCDADIQLRTCIGLIIHGLDVIAGGSFIISPPSPGYVVINDCQIRKLPSYIQALVLMHSYRVHGLSPEEGDKYKMDNDSQLWEFLRNINPDLHRYDCIKALSVAKHYYNNSYNIARYWSALSDSKFPGAFKFKETWDSLFCAEATPGTLLYLAKENPWERNILPLIPFKKLKNARELAISTYKEAKWLIERRNRLTLKEEQALMAAADLLAFSLYAKERERIAIPLPTGFGKSTLIRAFIKLLIERGIDKKIMVCVASHSEILESIKDLREMGLTGEHVGVFTSKNYKSDWDVNTQEDIMSKQILYICHNRVYNASDYKDIQFLAENGDDKRLVFWDESAQTTKGHFTPVANIEDQLLGLICRMDKSETKRDDDAEDFYLWLSTLKDMLAGSKYGRIWMDKIEIPAEFPYYIGTDLRTLIADSGCYTTFTKHGKHDELLISTEIKIPDEVQCIIFDASAQVRDLITYDRSIKYLHVDVERDYSSCTIYCVNIGSSKHFLNDGENVGVHIEILKKWMDEHTICGEELLQITQKIRIIIVDGRPETIDIPSRLEREIPGINVITWGMERGVNEYSKLKYAANIGMKWRDQRDLHADILAQKRVANSHINRQETSKVQRSEFLSEVQQWITRTNMRVSKDGRAKETKILFMHSEATKIAEELSRTVFPGLKVELFDCGIATKEQQREEYIKRIVEFLRETDLDSISTKALKERLGLNCLTKGQWKTISYRAEEDLIFEWERDERSWVKYFSLPTGTNIQENVLVC